MDINTYMIPPLLRLLPGWWGHLSSHTLLEDDQIFLHQGELDLALSKSKGVPMGKAYFAPSPADTYVLALHRCERVWTGVDRCGRVWTGG